MKRLFGELRRRRVFGTAALYIVGAWLVLQVVDIVFPALDIPDSAIRYVLYAAALGFPIALVFGWYFDISAGGIHRTLPSEPIEGENTPALGRGDFLVLATLVLVAGAIIYYAASNIAPNGADVPQPAAVSDGPPMIAVLPFTASGRENDSEFFAAGIHDDLLTQLAQLQSMRVISRTSVLEYKGTTRNIREIGAELGADAVLEGGVQSAGDRIRINAQLIDARTDEHLWAETFDRELTPANIFEVQSDISRAIASAMNATLTQHDDRQLSVIPTENMAAYRAWLKALKIRNEQSTWLREQYAEALEEAIEHDPEFVLAMAELVGYLSHGNFYYEANPDYTRQSEELLERIHVLAPGSPTELLAMAFYTYYTLRDFDGALELVNRALALSPGDTRLLAVKTWIQRRAGDSEGRVETLREIIALDPRIKTYKASLVNQLMLLRRYDDARAELASWEDKNYIARIFSSVLDLRDHRDLARWAEDVKEVSREFAPNIDPEHLWTAAVVVRDYATAEYAASVMDEELRGPVPYISERLTHEMLNAKFQDQPQRLAPLVAEAREVMGGVVNAEDIPDSWSVNLDWAFIAALEGQEEAAERYIRRWVRALDNDLASKSGHWHSACRLFALLEQKAAALECLEDVLTGESTAHWFIELYLPFYDFMRDTAEFDALMEGFENAEAAR